MKFYVKQIEGKLDLKYNKKRLWLPPKNTEANYTHLAQFFPFLEDNDSFFT